MSEKGRGADFFCRGEKKKQWSWSLCTLICWQFTKPRDCVLHQRLQRRDHDKNANIRHMSARDSTFACFCSTGAALSAPDTSTNRNLITSTLLAVFQPAEHRLRLGKFPGFPLAHQGQTKLRPVQASKLAGQSGKIFLQNHDFVR